MNEITPKHGATLIMDDICPMYIKLAKRLDQLSKMAGKGMCVINVNIVLIDGDPILWMRPEVNNLATSEPRGYSDTFLDRIKKIRR